MRPRKPFLSDITHIPRQSMMRLFDIVLPPHSLISGQPLIHTSPEADTLLWKSLKFLDDPCCTACGYPFEYDQGVASLCPRCHAWPPAFDKARAAIVYEEASRKIILDFKHGGRTDGLKFFAHQLHRVGHDLLPKADLLIPVPLHKKRLRQRRFNQSALLARALSKASARPYATNILLRARNTPPQGAFTASGRRRNVAGAFHIRKQAGPEISGKTVILIDDVFTTGATLSACAKTLKNAGAKYVYALALMRVVRPLEIPA